MSKVLIVKEVNRGGQGEEIGLSAGDIIFELNNFPIRTNSHFSDAIKFAKESGSEVSSLVVMRNGKRIEFDVQLKPFGIICTEEWFDNSLVTLTTSNQLEGYAVTETLNIVTAECAMGMNLIVDVFTAATDIFGGRSGKLQKTLKDAKDYCLSELRKNAFSEGANAVIGVGIAYSEFSGQGKSMLFVVASGTAVRVEKVK